MVRYVAAVAILLAAAAVVRPPAGFAQAVADLEVTPQAVSVVVGERREVLATAYDRDGDIASVSFVWTSSNPGVVMVEEEPGLPGVAYVIGVTPGTASVQVQAGGRTATLQAEVGGGALAGPAGTGRATVLQVDPTRVFLFPTEDLQLRLIFLKDDGSPAAPEAVQWRSFRPEVANIDGTGRVVGLSEGTGLVEAATSSGLTRRVQVQVGQAEWGFAVPVVSLSPALSDTVLAIVPSQGNRVVPPRSLQWGSTNRNVATVTPLGVVTAISGGQTELVAIGFGQEHRLPVTVHREVEGLSVYSPPGDTIVVPLGGPVTFRATALAADDTPVPQAPLIWVVGDTSIATYSVADTAAIGKGLGMTDLTVQAPGGLEKTWTLNVVAAGLVLDAPRVGMGVGEERALVARFADDLGRPLARASGVVWTSSNSEVARVNTSGRVTGTGIGRAEIIASSPLGVSDTATVFVQREILFSSTRAGTGDIYGFDRGAADQVQQITEGPGDDFSPEYSPDGSRIAFVSTRDGNFELYVMDADGSNLQRLTDTRVTEGDPSWVLGGQRIVYHATDEVGGIHVWSMNADGSDQRQLTTGAGVNLMPAASPDGRRVAFTSTRQGNYDVFVMDADGSNQQNFTSSSNNEMAPAWISDSVLAFVREERGERVTNRTVVSVGPSGQETQLTRPDLAIMVFAVSGDGETLAAIATNPDGSGDQRMILLPVGGGTPVEVPKVTEREQQQTPAFRR
jgi:Tol biopolymer transport system component